MNMAVANQLLQVDKTLLKTVRESIRQGFSWATREGPLCEERKSPRLSLIICLLVCISLARHVSVTG